MGVCYRFRRTEASVLGFFFLIQKWSQKDLKKVYVSEVGSYEIARNFKAARKNLGKE